MIPESSSLFMVSKKYWEQIPYFLLILMIQRDSPLWWTPFHCYDQGSGMKPGVATGLCMGVGFPFLLLWNLYFPLLFHHFLFHTLTSEINGSIFFFLLCGLLYFLWRTITSTPPLPPAMQCCGGTALIEVTETLGKTCRLFLVAGSPKLKNAKGKMVFSLFLLLNLLL